MAEVSSSTAGRQGWTTGGYYADPSSPIASTPQRPKGRRQPATPGTGQLSPMRQPERPKARKVHPGGARAAGDVSDGEEQKGLFSPTLHFDDEDGDSADGRSERSPGRSRSSLANLRAAPEATAAPSLAAAPAGRAADGTMASRARETPPRSSVSDRDRRECCTSATVTHSHSVYSYSKTTVGNGVVQETYYTEEEEEEEYFQEFNPYLFIKLLPPYSEVAVRTPRVSIPRKPRMSPPISLVLDLDETLVHCSVDPIPDADLTFPVNFNGATYQVYVRKRPFLDRFLAAVADRFEVIVFTASQQVYAEKLLNLLDPEKRYIRYRLYRDSCLNVEGNFLKDLTVLGRDLTKTVLVDNSPHAFGYQVENGIPIESWFDDRSDTELLKLERFLNTLLGHDDVRPVVRSKFQLHRLIAEA